MDTFKGAREWRMMQRKETPLLREHPDRHDITQPISYIFIFEDGMRNHIGYVFNILFASDPPQPALQSESADQSPVL